MVAEVEVEVVAATIAIKMGTCLGNVPKADLEAEDVAVADSEVIFYILIYSIIISKNSSIIHKYFFAKIFHSSSIFQFQEVVGAGAEVEATETVMEVPLEANFPMMLDTI